PHARPLQRGAGSPRLPTHVERGRAGAWGRGGAAATGDSRGAARLSPSVASPERSRIIARQLMGKDIELAILFADVVGSTRLYDTMGDLRARDMVAICIDVMRGATEQRQGTVIKTMGDEVMATFPTADAALNAAAQMQQQIATQPRSGHHLRLRLQWQDRELLVDERHSSVTIGRAEDNDMVVKGNLISRLHARIEISRNKFVLIDQSTNGTFVQSADGEESFVRRDSLQIKGQGMIGLGRLPERGSPQTIGYACEEA